MIPLQLTLKNFLSYREATLDFRGLHVACISGSNGAGKSSLLEAIAWSVWGESRAATEDDIIHLGEAEAQVNFTFQCRGQTYRVIRARQRGQNSSLEFQVQTETGFRSLTEKGIRATQDCILRHIRLDYETFINSAYLRQGRADEFMLKRPSERKQILADLLKLDQYELLADQSRERSRQIKAELDVLQRSLEHLSQQMQQADAIATELAERQALLEQQQQQQEIDTEALRQLQILQQRRQAQVQQLDLHQQQHSHTLEDCQRLQQELDSVHQQLFSLERVLQQAEAIAAGYAEYHSLQVEEEAQTAKFHAHQAAQTRRQQLQQQFERESGVLKEQISKLQVQIETLQQEEKELLHSLRKQESVEAALAQLQQARAQLTQYDHLQMQAAPLLQRRQVLQSQLEQWSTRLQARLETLNLTVEQLQQHQKRQPALQQAEVEIAELAQYLERRRAYQSKVREKGTERRTFMERLQEDQRKCEAQLAELDQKIALLHREEVGVAQGAPSASLSPASSVAHLSAHTASPADDLLCPLCDRPLDEHHRRLVQARYQQEREELLRQVWVIREQLTTSEREIQVLRQEYRDLDKELSHYSTVLERRGQLQQQLRGMSESEQQLQRVLEERSEIERLLQTAAYAPELQAELHELDQTLRQLNYDDRDHALIRGEVDRWRWAEIKNAELKQAQRRLAHLQTQYPELLAQKNALEQEVENLAHSTLQQEMRQADRELEAIAYDPQRHAALRKALRQTQGWQLRHQELLHAQQQYPQVKRRANELKQLLQQRQTALQEVSAQIQQLEAGLQQTPDPGPDIYALEQQMQQRRLQLDEHLAQVGRLQQQQQHLQEMGQQQAALVQQQNALQRELRVYQELSLAFGKNGIQALMIENVLPHLEAETNLLLGKLSNHQLHVQFVTQKSRKDPRGSKAKQSAPKFIETLDILIADAQGTRPYETYSGGEAFRINFAIRLALARLLSQRSGAALQLLIVDEGFGTQDEAGCDRLVAAIQAIAADFACILTVTHMPRLKEAFQTRIEVVKTPQGSQISLSV